MTQRHCTGPEIITSHGLREFSTEDSIQRLWVIWGQCCLRVAADPCLPNGPITQLSPYLTWNPCIAYFMDITTPDSCCVKTTLLRHAEKNTGIEVTFMTEISPFNTIVSISWLVTSQSIGCHVMERARLDGDTSSFCLPPLSASFIQTCLMKYIHSEPSPWFLYSVD